MMTQMFAAVGILTFVGVAGMVIGLLALYAVSAAAEAIQRRKDKKK